MDNIEQGIIVFDTESGISMEEQKEILDKINSLNLEKGMIPEDRALKSEAKKRGILFPLLLNIAALLFLAGGFFLLWNFFNITDHDIRTSAVILSLDEQRLLREIRLETSRLLNEKENQINFILLSLDDIEVEYRQLEMSVETLSDEQRARAEYLLNLQDEYNATLTQLRAEQIQIIEDARQMEMQLRAEAESRVRTLSLELEQSGVELGAAMEEMARLSRLQDRAAVAETHNIALQAEINTIRGELQTAEIELQAVTARVSATETARASLQEQNSNLQGQVAGLASERDGLTAERSRLQQQLAETQQQLDIARGILGISPLEEMLYSSSEE